MSVGSEQDWQQAKAAVLARHPDAKIYCAVTSNGSFAVGSKAVDVTIGAQKWSKEEAWIDAAENLAASSAHPKGESR